MAFTPSKYQKTLYTYIQKAKGNAVVEAVAGGGKTSSLVNAIKLIPSDKQVLFLAFNKSIVEELKIKVGNLENVTVSTIHSLGAKVCRKYLKCNVDDNKYKTWLNDGIKSGFIAPINNLSNEDREEWLSNIRKLIDLGRVNLTTDEQGLNELAYKHGLWILDNEVQMAIRGIDWGVHNTDIIDYTDMIYLPVVKDMKVWQYDWVFIDECQDLNAAQRNMFLKHVKMNGRFVAVGDPKQAIYGFAGADVESFNLLKQLPHTAKLPLSVCYRCDKSIIELAKTEVPQIEAREDAPDGIINYDAKIADVQDGDMVLCRVSAPLVDLCMRYIANGVKAYVKGRDIGMNLINMIKKTKKAKISDLTAVFDRELSRIIGKVVAKLHCSGKEAMESDAYTSYQDKVKAIEILSEGLVKCDDLISRVETIFSDESKNGICLSTVHKSKGLESDRVFIICPEKFLLKNCMQIPWMAEQEHNLQYVAYTRAKHYLGFITDFKTK